MKQRDWYWLCQNRAPVCPYCESKQSLDDLFLREDETALMECEKCQKQIRVTPIITRTFDTHGDCEVNGEMPHRLYPGLPGVGPYTCQGCYQEFYDWQLPGGKYPRLRDGEFVVIADPAKSGQKEGT